MENILIKGKRKKNNKVIRIPRPLGLTYQIRNELKEEDKERTNSKAINLIITHWIMNGMRMNGEYTGNEEMANWLGLPITQLMKITNEVYIKTSQILNLDKNNNEDFQKSARGWLKMLQSLALETFSHSQKQTAILAKNQGDEYVPFLTSELNKSISNNISSFKPMLEILSIMKEGNQVNNFLGPTQINSNTDGTGFLSREKAMEMIKKNDTSILDNPTLLEQKESQIKAQLTLPEVDARIQGMKIEMVEKSNTKSKDKNLHENRISNEINQVENQDDFVG